MLKGMFSGFYCDFNGDSIVFIGYILAE